MRGVFKTGRDFLDPMILERASGNPVYQLDLWMGGEDHCRRLLYEAAGEADLILIEGVIYLTGEITETLYLQGTIHEIKSCDILQPGPAALTDGMRQIHAIVRQWADDPC